MKNLPVLFQSLLLVGAVILMPNGSAAAAPSLSTPDSWQSAETVLPVDDTAALLQSPDSAALIQLGSGRLDVLSPKQQVLEFTSSPIRPSWCC
ncbi:hypothetical protein B9G55_16615 [Saccharibacillus sp. O16]|nr:hypothetical protein B9G55_16615 [Saccharibacillus sp. O16]